MEHVQFRGAFLITSDGRYQFFSTSHV
jgi:hypothetical protein